MKLPRQVWTATVMSSRHVADRRVHRLRVHRGVLLRLVAELAERLLHLRVAHHRDRRVVDLQIAAAGLVEVGDLLAVGLRQIGPELVQVRIGLLERLAVAARVQHRRRRHAELGGALRDRFQELEMIEHVRLRAPDLARHPHQRRLLVGVLELARRRSALQRLHAAEAAQEVDVPPVAAELAVGDALQRRPIPAT